MVAPNRFTRLTIGRTKAYIANIVFGHFCVSMALPVRLSLLRDHIVDVFTLSPEKKVFRIHATAIITLMQNIESVRDWATMSNPSGAMCAHVNPIQICKSVSMHVDSALPNPTACEFVNNVFHWGKPFHWGQPAVVAFNESNWLSFYPPSAGMSFRSEAGLFAATAVAGAVRNRGRIRVRHCLTSLSGLVMRRAGGDPTLPGFSLPQLYPISKP